MKAIRIESSLLERVRRVAGRAERGFWVRAVPPSRKEEERQILQAAIEGGRVNPPGGFAVMYAAERKGGSDRYLKAVRRACLDRDPLLVTILKVALRRVLDLSDADVRRALGVRDGPPDLGLAQRIGAAAYEAGFEGVVYPRPLGRGDRNLAIFLDRVSLRQLDITDAFLLPRA